MDIETFKATIARKWFVAKYKAREGFNKTVDFVINNKEAIAIVTPVALASIKFGTNVTNDIKRKRYLKQEQTLKDCYIYDRSIGMYYETRRPMTSNERIEFSNRKHSGESVGNILRSMKLL